MQKKLAITSLFFLFLYIEYSFAQNDIGEECYACMRSGPVQELSQGIGEITNSFSCANGSTVKLFGGVNEARCNQFGTTTYQFGQSPSYRYDSYLTLAGRNFNFNLGFSNVADRIAAANRSNPPNMFDGYVSSTYGGCARTPTSMRQIRRYYCFNFAREIEAKVNAVIDGMFNSKDLNMVKSCLNDARNFMQKKQCYLTTYNLDQTWITSLENAAVEAQEFARQESLPDSEKAIIIEDFQERFVAFINQWAQDSLNSIAGLEMARTLARQASLREHAGSETGSCEDRIGALYQVWPDLFNFSSGGSRNKSNDFAYCMQKQNGVDLQEDQRRNRISRNLVMGIGFAASVAAIPMTGGSSAAIAAGIISGVSGVTVGGMTLIEGHRRENMIPLQMQAGNIRVSLAGNTPAANAQLQREYEGLRRDVNAYYRNGTLGIVTSIFLAGGGGTMIVNRLSLIADKTPQIISMINFFTKLGDTPAARVAMYGLVSGAGIGYVAYRMQSPY